MNWGGKKVLITGAGGFIGSHLAERLVTLGANVKAFVHYNSSGKHGWLDQSLFAKEMEIQSGDICDPDSVFMAVKDQEFVFHLAALIAIPYSYISPLSYIRTNIEGTANILRSSRTSGVERLICTSTSEVYGTALYTPIDEKHPLQGQSPYSASKIGADKMIEAFYRSFDLPVVTVRPFNTFGPRQSLRAIIPTIITQLMQNNSINLGNLKSTRDLNYIDNTVAGFIASAENENAIGRVINFGSGKEISIYDLAVLISSIMGKGIEISVDENRLRPEKSEVEQLLANNSLAKSLLNWVPQVSLEEGLQKTVEWFQSNREGYNTREFVL